MLQDDGALVQCSRTLAVVYYCSSVWEASWGGALVDLESSERHSDTAVDAARGAAAAVGLKLPPRAKLFPPKFNRLVVFSVPRFHQVTPVIPQPDASGTPRLRLSIFGWFMQPGRLYPLMTGVSGEDSRPVVKHKKSAAAVSSLKPVAPQKRKRCGAGDYE